MFDQSARFGRVGRGPIITTGIILAIIALSYRDAHAVTRTVGASDQDHTTIAAAVSAASSGDVIRVMDAVHTESGITVNKNLTIEGLGTASTTVQAHASRGSASTRVFSISNSSTVTIRNMTIRHGKLSSGYGGGVYFQGSTNLILNNCIVTANDTGSYGGGVGGTGFLTLTDSRIDDNSAVYGGGFQVFATATISGCAITNNVASVAGGGVYTGSLGGNPAIVIRNTTFSGNRANSDGAACTLTDGVDTPTVSFINATITNNRCDYDNNTSGTGGGLAVWGGNANVTNTIIANNYKGPIGSTVDDLSGTFTSGDYNLFRSTTGATINGTTTHNITGADPELDALADNSGPTPTHALQLDSPALDAIPNGTNGMGTSPLDKDQRGYTRPVNSAGDIGAFEHQSSLPAVTTVDVTAISAPTASSGGDVSFDGDFDVTARGICWGLSPSPTIANSMTTDGSGMGDFASALAGLASGTTYYVRAYATNSLGTAYGNEKSFATAALVQSQGNQNQTENQVESVSSNESGQNESTNEQAGAGASSNCICGLFCSSAMLYVTLGIVGMKYRNRRRFTRF